MALKRAKRFRINQLFSFFVFTAEDKSFTVDLIRSPAICSKSTSHMVLRIKKILQTFKLLQLKKINIFNFLVPVCMFSKMEKIEVLWYFLNFLDQRASRQDGISSEETESFNRSVIRWQSKVMLIRVHAPTERRVDPSRSSVVC